MNKKPSPPKPIAARQPKKMDAVTLHNLALQPTSASVAPDDDALAPIVEMLAKLWPSNLHLVENIIRVIVDEQSREN